jgi:hypothetical protein
VLIDIALGVGPGMQQVASFVSAFSQRSLVFGYRKHAARALFRV